MSNFISSLRNSHSSNIHSTQQTKPVTASKSLIKICEIAYLIIICILCLLVVGGAMTTPFSVVGLPICLISLAILIIICVFNPCLIRWIFTKKTEKQEDLSITEDVSESSWYSRGKNILSDAVVGTKNTLEKSVDYVTNKLKTSKKSESQLERPLPSSKHAETRRYSEVESSDSSAQPYRAAELELSKSTKNKTKTMDKISKRKKLARRKTISKPLPEKKETSIENQNSESESSVSSSPLPSRRSFTLPWFCKQTEDNINKQNKISKS